MKNMRPIIIIALAILFIGVFEIAGYFTGSPALPTLIGKWPLGGGYYKDFKSVYGPYAYEHLGVIPAADVGTFTLVSSGDGFGAFAKDKDHAYWGTDVIPGVDPSTFQVVNNGFWFKDKDHVYRSVYVVLDTHGGAVPEVMSADPSTFEAIGKTEFAKDKNHVFSSDKILAGADPKTFQILLQQKGQFDAGFEKDAKYAWYGTSVIPGADGATFVMDGATSAKDSSHTYVGAYSQYLMIDGKQTNISVWQLPN